MHDKLPMNQLIHMARRQVAEMRKRKDPVNTILINIDVLEALLAIEEKQPPPDRFAEGYRTAVAKIQAVAFCVYGLNIEATTGDVEKTLSYLVDRIRSETK